MVFDRIKQYFQGRSNDLPPETPSLSGAVEANFSAGHDNDGAKDHGGNQQEAAGNGRPEPDKPPTLMHQSSSGLPVFPANVGRNSDGERSSNEPISALKKILDTDKLQQEIEIAKTLYHERKWGQTINQCQVVLGVDPSHAPIHKLMGNALMQMGEKDDARNAYKLALENDPSFADAYVNLGNLEAQDKQWDGAIAHYQQAIALKPDFAGAYRNLAKVWTHKGNERLATECLFHAIEREPDSLDWQEYLKLGNQLLAQGQPKQAIHCYQYLLAKHNVRENSQINNGTDGKQSGQQARSPSWTLQPFVLHTLHQNLADALTQIEQWQEAVSHYRQAQRIQLAVAPLNPIEIEAVYPGGSLGLGDRRLACDISPLLASKPDPVTQKGFTEMFNPLGFLEESTQLPLDDVPPKAQENSQSKNGAALSNSDSAIAVQSNSNFQTAQELAQQRQWSQVLTILQQELEAIEPELNQCYELFAKALRIEGDLDGAMAYYKKMLMLYPQQAKPFANLGSIYAQQEQWQEAKAVYQQAIQLDPNFAGAYRNLARVYQTTGEEETAADCWAKAHELEPHWGDASVHLELGAFLVRLGRGEDAIASFKRAIAKDDTLTTAYFQLAELYHQQQNDELAIFHYGKALQSDVNQSDPNHCDAIYGLGHLLAKHGDRERAIACFQKLIELAPSDIRGYESLRDVLVAAGNLSHAISCYEQLARLQPDSSKVYHEWGDALNQLERWQEAIPVFQQAIHLNADFSWSHNNLGDALLHLGQWQDAAAAFRTANQLNPSFAWSYYNLGEALVQLEDWDGAITAYRQALEQEPTLPHCHQKIGDALKNRATADMEQALGHYDQAIQQDPSQVDSYHKRLELKKDDPDLYVQLAQALLRQGERTEAIVACQMGLQFATSHMGLKTMLQGLMQQEQAASYPDENQIYPQSESSDHGQQADIDDLDAIADRPWDELFDLGNQFQLQGKLDAAIFAYERAIDQNPSHSWSYHQLGDTYLKQERWSDAVTAYQSAIALNNDYFWSHYNLGVAYMRQNKWHEAIAAYRSSIDENPGLNLPCLALRDTLLKQWDSLFGRGDQFLREGDRDAARAFYRQAIQSYQQRLYLPPIDVSAPLTTNLLQETAVLIIADDFLPQCHHYRVQQKLEQLEIAGFSSQYVSKQDVAEARNALHFCHVVIFYRVPALPDIIELIQYAKALGKIVFYEIDDLIFDEILYPAPFETYGGRISMDEYYGLIRGSTLFREAMALCDYAIASTPALVKVMKPIVAQRQAYLHRNALDHLNSDFGELKIPKIQRDYLSIFYGSGTKAHDTDFNQLAAPAIARIFERYPHVRLTLVGYVTLPPILEPYRDRIDQIPLIKEVDVYWELLQQADINIAVLEVKTETDCKSEIKWLEAAALGIPSIVSATQTYREILTHGVDGFLVRTPDDWFESLDILVRDKTVRHEIAQQAKTKAWEEYSLSAMGQNIRHIIANALALAYPNLNASQNVELIDSPPTPTPQKTKTKLLIVNVFYPPQSIGGATRIVKDNVQVLTEEYGDRYDISVFTTDDDYPEAYRMTQYTHNGIPVTKVSTPQEEGMDWRYKNSKMYDIFQDYLKFNPPDLIHFHCVQRLTGSVLAAAYDLDIPYLVTVHDAWWVSDYQFLVNEEGVECSYQQNDPLVTAMGAKDVGRSLQRCRYLKQQLNQAQEVLAVSEAFANIYRQNGFPQTQANRNGIMPRPRLPRKPNPTGKVRFAHVGGMSAHKGYYLFKEAVEAANLENSEVIIVDHSQTVGSVSYGQWGTTPVTFVAKIPQDQMPEFYSTIDVLVAPSMWPESFGLVTREAAAAGVWVIASDKGALAEDIVVGKNGNIISIEDTQDLLEIIETIDQGQISHHKIDGNPQENIRTTFVQVNELLKCYENCLSI
ncbi:MAG: tetratricopeptide repeat protein [Cyanobacteria bacterium P01_F01_bin.150]